MSDKTNEEKLRILQERLASIQQKKEIQQEEKVQQNKPVAPIFEEDLVNEPKKESDVIKKKSSAWKIIFFIIIGSLTGYFGYHFFNEDFKIEPTIENIKEDFDDMYVSLFGNDDKDEDDKEKKKKNKKVIYNKSSFDGNFIIILKNSDKKELADAEAQNLIEKGYNCDVLQLSGVSNSEEEIFQTYIQGKNIGVGFETKEEAMHYLNSTELISEGSIFKLQ